MKFWKKALAVVGIMAVICSCLFMTVSADDSAIISSNIVLTEDFYNVKQFEFEAGGRYLTAGSPFTVYRNTSGNQNTWDSRDRFSIYEGSGVYYDIPLQHNGLEQTHKNGTSYYEVETYMAGIEITEGNETYMYNRFEVQYDYFLWSGEWLDTRWNPKGQEFLTLNLIPYIKVYATNDYSGQLAISYNYSYYGITENQAGSDIRKTEIDNILYISPRADGYYYIPILPIETNEDGSLNSIGKITAEELQKYKAQLWEDIKVSFAPRELSVNYNNTEDFEISYVTFFDINQIQEYPATFEDFIGERETYKNVYVEADVGTFLADSTVGFLNFEIYPGLSLLAILGVIVAIPLLIAILKLFAGG